MKNIAGWALVSVLLLSGCRHGNTQADVAVVDSAVVADTVVAPVVKPTKSRTALYLDSLGYLNVAEQDSTIAVDLMYARADNFTGQVLYGDLREAYLHPNAMACLLEAQRLLRSEYPGYRLIVYDAARPMSVQKIMWDKVKGTSKKIYVSNPAHGGGLHNYGLAVDVGILDADGVPLSMGVPVDYMGKESHIASEDEMVRTGKMTEQERENRRLLRRVMRKAGFRPLPTEWWHFNYCSRAEARSRYKCID